MVGDHVRSTGMGALTEVASSDRHIVNVFVWPAGRSEAPQVMVRKGFNLQHWSNSAMQVWVVSDADAGEVAHFSNVWRGQVVNSAKAERQLLRGLKTDSPTGSKLPEATDQYE